MLIFALLMPLILQLNEVSSCKSKYDKSKDIYRSNGVDFTTKRCINYNIHERDESCRAEDDNFKIEYYPGMDSVRNELKVYDGDIVNLPCKANRQWSKCGVDQYKKSGYKEKNWADYSEKLWDGPHLICLGVNNCTNINYNLQAQGRFGFLPERKHEHYDDNACNFVGEVSMALSGKWRCKVYSYTTTERDPVCCRYAEATFSIVVLPKPKAEVYSFPPSGKTRKCRPLKDRNKLCLGNAGMRVVDSPNLLSGEKVILKEGALYNISCQSNFQWGQCGVLFWPKEGAKPLVNTRVLWKNSLSYLYCPWKTQDCQMNIDSQTFNPFNLRLYNKYVDNRCTFEGTVTPDWEGTYMCAIYAPGPDIISYENCCLRAYSVFNISVILNKNIRRTTTPSPIPDYKSDSFPVKDDISCEVPKFTSRHKYCYNPNYAVIYGPGPIYGKKIEVTAGSELNISCQPNAPWSDCAVEQGSKESRKIVNCDYHECEGALQMNRSDGSITKYTTQPCTFSKIAEVSDTGKDWRCYFYAVDMYNSHWKTMCCSEIYMDFEVYVSTTGASTTAAPLDRPEFPFGSNSSDFYSFLPKMNKASCNPELVRHKTCRGNSGFRVVDSPNLATGEKVILKEGVKYNISCQSNFKWGQCGLLFWPKPVSVNDLRWDKRISLSYLYCRFSSANCEDGVDSQTENLFNFTLINQYADDRCTFEGTVTPEWEGTYLCAIFAPGPGIATYENCCRRAHTMFKISVITNKTARKIASQSPNPEHKSIITPMEDDLNCEVPKVTARHKYCYVPDYAVIKGPGQIYGEKIEVTVGSQLNISCEVNSPWTDCVIDKGGKTMAILDCGTESCKNTLEMKRTDGSTFKYTNEPCTLTKIAELSDTDNDWRCQFIALDMYNTFYKTQCCSETYLPFEVVVSPKAE